jgi:urease accessory protein
MAHTLLQQLALFHLADSALPIGATAHSFGLETLVAEGSLTVPLLATFLGDYLAEAGRLEGGYCRAAHRLATLPEAEFSAAWRDLSWRLSALKPARESRQASAVLGRRLLNFVLQVAPSAVLQQAAAPADPLDLHHSCVFGLVGGALGVDVELTVSVLLQQMTTSLVSACQRLLPLGQSQAHQLLWDIKPLLVATAAASAALPIDDLCCFAPGLELASLRHPQLATRLFIS